MMNSTVISEAIVRHASGKVLSHLCFFNVTFCVGRQIVESHVNLKINIFYYANAKEKNPTIVWCSDCSKLYKLEACSAEEPDQTERFLLLLIFMGKQLSYKK